MSLKIGPVSLDSPVILAPMSGVTDMPFRRLVKSCGVGLVVSEMIASKAMVHAARKTLKMASHCAEEHPMAVQLAGCEPDVMAEAARLNEDRGASLIDINMGCPVKKVTNGDAGSALMRDERLAAGIFKAVVGAVGIDLRCPGHGAEGDCPLRHYAARFSIIGPKNRRSMDLTLSGSPSRITRARNSADWGRPFEYQPRCLRVMRTP